MQIVCAELAGITHEFNIVESTVPQKPASMFLPYMGWNETVHFCIFAEIVAKNIGEKLTNAEFSCNLLQKSQNMQHAKKEPIFEKIFDFWSAAVFPQLELFSRKFRGKHIELGNFYENVREKRNVWTIFAKHYKYEDCYTSAKFAANQLLAHLIRSIDSN